VRLQCGGRQENSLRTVCTNSQVLYANTGWSCCTNKSDVQAAASERKGEVGCADTNSVWHTSDQQLTMYLPVRTRTTHCKHGE